MCRHGLHELSREWHTWLLFRSSCCEMRRKHCGCCICTRLVLKALGTEHKLKRAETHIVRNTVCGHHSVSPVVDLKRRRQSLEPCRGEGSCFSNLQCCGTVCCSTWQCGFSAIFALWKFASLHCMSAHQKVPTVRILHGAHMEKRDLRARCVSVPQALLELRLHYTIVQHVENHDGHLTSGSTSLLPQVLVASLDK